MLNLKVSEQGIAPHHFRGDYTFFTFSVYERYTALGKRRKA